MQRQLSFTFFPLASQYWAAQLYSNRLKALKYLLIINLNILNTDKTIEWFIIYYHSQDHPGFFVSFQTNQDTTIFSDYAMVLRQVEKIHKGQMTSPYSFHLQNCKSALSLCVWSIMKIQSGSDFTTTMHSFKHFGYSKEPLF